MKGLYVLGGRRKQALLRTQEEWRAYGGALILELDLETGASRVRVDYETPPDARPGPDSSVLFTAGSLCGDKLYACTSTEVLVYQLPQFSVLSYVSLPCFNDLHHVCPTAEGHLLAVSTGLDMVVEFTRQGEVLREWNVLGEDPWGRFSRDIDYRKVATTKPHRSHPNYVFHLGDDIWVTRFEQRDAVCLTRPGGRIAIDVERVHDGHVRGEWIYFTTVDGQVVIVDRKTLRVSTVVDLKRIDNEGQEPLGWCRGLWIVDESKVWVGFGRVRHTQFMQNLNWMRRALRRLERPTHLALYDLAARHCLQEIDLETWGMNAVFSIFPAVESGRGQDQPDEETSTERLAEVRRQP
jgi:hypothetical protein